MFSGCYIVTNSKNFIELDTKTKSVDKLAAVCWL